MSKKRRERDMPQSERIFEFLKQISRLQSSSFFRKPVDVVEYKCPNYYEVISNPMDLQTIQDKLIAGQNIQLRSYKKVSEIMEDLQQIVENCETYNPDADSMVRKSCLKFQQCFENRYISLQKTFQDKGMNIEEYEIDASGYEALEQKDQQNQVSRLQKNTILSGLVDNLNPIEKIQQVVTSPVYLKFNITQQQLDDIEIHKIKQQKKYRKFINEKIQKIIEFIQKTNKNHLFADIQGMILDDKFLTSPNKDFELVDLLRFNQKLILWFRAFHKQDDIFKKTLIKKKFFKHLQFLTKSTLRLVKFTGNDFCTNEQQEESNIEVQKYYEMIQENQFLSQNLKAHSQNPDKKRSSDRTYHRKHKKKDFDGCEKDKFNKTLKNLLNRKVTKYQQIQQENNQQAQKEQTIQEINQLNNDFTRMYDEIQLDLETGNLEDQEMKKLETQVVEKNQKQGQQILEEQNESTDEDLDQLISKFDQEIQNIKQKFSLPSHNTQFVNNQVMITENRVIEELNKYEVQDFFFINFEMNSFYGKFSEQEKDSYKKICEEQKKKISNFQQQINAKDSKNKKNPYNLQEKMSINECLMKDLNKEERTNLKQIIKVFLQFQIDKYLKLVILIQVNKKDISTVNKLFVKNQIDIPTYNQIKNNKFQIYNDLQNIYEIDMKRQSLLKILNRINTRFETILPFVSNSKDIFSDYEVIFFMKINLAFKNHQSIKYINDKQFMIVKACIPIYNIDQLIINLNDLKII